MILIIGGAFQGKLTYGKTLAVNEEAVIADGRTCGKEAVLEADIADQFHQLLFRLFEEGEDISRYIERLLRVNPDVIIIGDELGCGLVPVDQRQRHLREQTGRIYCRLAENAAEVHRVTCGIGTRIKGAGRQ